MKNYLIFVVVLLGMTSSCKKFLEESSQSEVVPRTAESLNEFLLGDGYPTDAGFHPYERYMTDDIKMIDNNTDPTATSVYSWQPDMVERIPSGNSTWYITYKLIQTCNTTLDYLPKMEGKSNFKDYVAGQAYLLRAFYYFKLVNIYGLPYNDKKSDRKINLGVPLLTSGGVESTYKPRNTVEEVYSQIEKDLQEGIKLLDRSGYKHSKYRIGSDAGHLLASRVYLYMEKWDEVIKHTDILLDRPYSIVDLRSWGSVKPLEKPFISVENPETIWGFYGRNDILTNDTMTYRISADLERKYVDGDLRHGIYWSDGVYRKLSFADFGFKEAQVFRISEAYLNRAEAFAELYKQGNIESGSKCIELLNSLRQKRFSSDKYVPLKLETIGMDLLLYVREERRRELYNEGHRWFDLRRYGMPKIEHQFILSPSETLNYVLEEHDPSYVVPINSDIISLNSKIIQNPLGEIRKPK